MDREILINIIISAISLFISISFIIFGYSMIFEDAPMIFIAFSLGTMGYGIISLGCLMSAWMKKQNYSQNMSLFLSLAIVTVFFISSMDAGMISGLEWSGIIVIAFLAFMNWWIVRKITIYKKAA